LPKCADATLRTRRSDFRQAAMRLRVEPILVHLRSDSRRLALLGQRGDTAFLTQTQLTAARLTQASRLMDNLSYRSVLERGYAVVRGKAGQLLDSTAAVIAGEKLTIEFADGKADAIATGDAASRPRLRANSKSLDPGKQGSLF